MDAVDLRSHDWALAYRTSSVWPDGRPVDVMHDFYLPALKRATRYDRVAGYFRSSSLAAASQGFSAFVGHGGRMRMIVGADLDPADVRAILAGNAARLSELLLAELANLEAWQVAEQDGLRLLGLMVGSGVLEVKVALRVHGQSGEPLTWDDPSDGYVHEKWFVMGDEADNFVYGSGSLNESRTALVVNAENIDLHCSWMGQSDAMRVQMAISDFETLWENHRPHIRVLALPEAVRLRLIKLADSERPLREIDGTGLQPLQVSMSAKERLAWGLLADGPLLPNGRWVGLATAPITPWPHQMVVVRRLVTNWPYSYLLCDEVGLGKTIEAGLAFRCLYLAGLCQRIVVAAPASLTRQWQQQMAEKVLLAFALLENGPVQKHSYLLPEKQEVKGEATFEPDLLIVSTGILERQERQKQFLSARPFDLALVDEAHNARRSNSVKGTDVKPEYGKLYRFLQQRLRTHARCIYLATATPMQLHAVEVFDLMAFTRRGGAYLEDPALMQVYYQLLQRLRGEEALQEHEWQWLLQNLRQLERLDPPFWLFLQQSLLQDVKLKRAWDNWLNYAIQTPVPGPQSQRELGRLLTQATPLARVMLRHSRSLLREYSRHGELDQQLAERQSLLHLVSFRDREPLVYQRLEEYCRELQQQLGGDEQRKNTLMFYLSFLRQRFASSLYAINRTLERRLERVQETLDLQLRRKGRQQLNEEQAWDWDEDENDAVTKSLLKDRSIDDLRWEQTAVQALLRDLHSLRGTPSKVTELLQLLDTRRLPGAPYRLEQIVIFTRYFDTLNHLRRELQRSDSRLRLGVYSGGELSYYDAEQLDWHSSTREEVKQRFLRGEIDVLLCTDAAAEGLNLQSADTLVNFDLGWNPMKLEQRIGRIDRIGQKHSQVFIHNFCYRDSVEQVVYDRLGRRLEQAELIVGEQQLSLLPVTLEDFAGLASGELDEETLLQNARERLAAQRASAAAQELTPAEVYALYTQWNREWSKQQPPVELSGIEDLFVGSSWLSALGAEIKKVVDAFGEHRLLYWHPRDSVAQDTGCLFTWDRGLYDRGLAQSDHPLAFGSYGTPAFDRLLAAVRREALPQCVRRLTVPIPGLPGREQVGYAVAVTTGSGHAIQLVVSQADVAQLELAEHVQLTEPDVQACLAELQASLQREWQTMQAVPAIEERNIAAGRAQALFDLEVGAAMLDVMDDETFTRAMKTLREHFESKPALSLGRLPTVRLRPLLGDLLLPPEVPTVGDTMDYRVPSLVAQPALDAVSRHLHIDEDRRSLRREQAVSKLRNYLNANTRKDR